MAVTKGSRAYRVCEALNLSLRTLERWRTDLEDHRAGPKIHAKSLSTVERKRVLSVLTSEEHCDLSPHTLVAKLADDGQYLCSVSSMYRILRSNGLTQHRGRSKRPEKWPKVSARATGPNQVWCWDITFLPREQRGFYFMLYLFQDIFSRKIVGWTIHEREDSRIAKEVFKQCLISENITGENLRLHNDNGNAMKESSFVEKMKALGVIQSFSRPSVKDDNPYPEALFKTMKYRPSYPYRPFRTIEEAIAWVKHFVGWYNTEHLHSGIGYVTPNQRHRGEDKIILKKRAQVFEEARNRNPLRWSGNPKDWRYCEVIELNEISCRRLN